MKQLVLAALLLCCPAATADAPQPSVDALVQRHVDALGGIDRIHAIRSFVKHGWYYEGSLRLEDTYTAQRRPFYRVIGSPSHALDEIHEGYDGSAWEYYPDPGIVVRTIGQAARTARHTALFDDPLVDYKLHGTMLSYGGAQTYQGKPAYVIRVTLADGFQEDYFLDRETYMLDGRAQFVPMHAYGTRYDTHDVYGGYRPEGGVMFAHTDKEIDAATGKVLDEGGVRSVEINPDLPLSMFSPPEWKRTPLQEMIQRMYDERDEPVAVLATYRDFAPLVQIRSTAAADAIDFVGYQILKMGHTDSAVALLRQNLADHPNYPNAQKGLARALAATKRP